MDLLRAMDIFIHVVNTGSFAAAATQLGVSSGIATRDVQQLEEHLGARLINRTTRRLSVTDIGRGYYTFCTRVLREMRETESAIAHLQREPAGTLKLLVPKSFGSLHMDDALYEFMRQYPDIHIEATLSDYKIPSMDLVENGFDAALRLTSQRDSSLIARRLCTTDWVLCGAPSYVKAHGAPKSPTDLTDHNCLVHTNFPNGGWQFRQGRRRVPVKVSGGLRANSVLLIESLVRKGLGIAMLPTYCIHKDLESGKLVRLLSDYPPVMESIYVVYPHRKLLPVKVRLFIDFMATYFRTPPWELTGA